MEGDGSGDAQPSSSRRFLFPMAPQSDLVRASQKDAYYTNYFAELTHEVFSRVFGTRFATRHQSEITLLSNSGYFLLTTLGGNQTLGEEYCDIMQVHSGTLRPPRPLRRGLLFLLSILGPHLLAKAAARCRVLGQSTAPAHVLLRALCALQDPMARLNLGLFYLNGDYYTIPHRLSSIRHIFMKGSTEGRSGYQILGLLIMIQLIGAYVIEAKRLLAEPTQQDSAGDADAGSAALVATSKTCTLCLSPCTHPTATKCGHVFCWNCIHEACTVKSECPLCRQDVSMEELAPLYCY